jgi:FkbM family methyltransferase
MKPGYRVVTLPWKLTLATDPGVAIGRAIVRMGIYDLPVSETIWRLLEAGELAVDVGANIGYMTSIMAARVGTCGSVIAFEPHPDLFLILESNIFRWHSFDLERVKSYRIALSNRIGVGALKVPDDFELNRGLASLNESGAGDDIRVEVGRLENYIGDRQDVALLKVDVEGHELQVLQGCDNLLKERRVRDIVFEEFRSYPTPVTTLLEQFGYSAYQIGMTFWGPVLASAGAPVPGKRSWVARSMLATRDPERARRRLAPRGWQILRPKVRLNRSHQC